MCLKSMGTWGGTKEWHHYLRGLNEKIRHETYEIVICPSCDGRGRMVKKTTITYEKFVDEVRS
jgi:hypothetical protein